MLGSSRGVADRSALHFFALFQHDYGLARGKVVVSWDEEELVERLA